MKNLFVLPFDHRASFTKNMFGFTEPLTTEQSAQVTDYKNVIYEAIDKAIEMGIPKDASAVLVDEIYGMDILKDAKDKGLITMQTVEKSGKEEFEFEFDSEFGEHLLAVGPSYAKALVRYDVSKDNSMQLGRLKELSDFVHANNIGLLIEPLMALRGDQSDFDHNERYKDLCLMIREMQNVGIEADVWKIEGLYEKYQYEEVVRQARNRNDREHVLVIILGRNETKEHVTQWIQAGSSVVGVAGFAVGRTIFWQPLMDLKNQKITRLEAVEKIAQDYFEYYKVFAGGKVFAGDKIFVDKN
jgi:myo-inositol catabolism protein IolC